MTTLYFVEEWFHPVPPYATSVATCTHLRTLTLEAFFPPLERPSQIHTAPSTSDIDWWLLQTLDILESLPDFVSLCIVCPLEHDPTHPTAARPSPNAGISFFVNLPRKLKSIEFNGYHLHPCAWHLPRALDVASTIPHLENLLVLPNLQRFTVEHHPHLDSQTYDDYSE